MLAVMLPILSTLVSVVLPALGTSSASVTLVEQVITGLTALLPAAIEDGGDLIAAIKSDIAALSSSGSVTPAQLTALAALDAKCDEAEDAAAIAAGADPIPDLTASSTTAATMDDSTGS